MIKLISIKSFLTAIFLLTVIGVTNLAAQQLDHQLGVILIQLDEKAEIATVITSTQYFQNKKTDIKLNKLVSEPFRIWSFTFNHNQINEFDFLDFVRRHPLVENAQFDFWLEERTAPDDQFYYFQYYFHNTAQTGGTYGVDLDAEIAWETTTGGVSSNGDTIVICVIDESFERDHIDLVGNAWFNKDEIPGDSIDNDENGYIDDYFGWNVVDTTDDVTNDNNPGNHGTQVAGIAGAVGNNSIGVSGLNWNIKLMYVTRGYLTSHAIAAYTYPYKSRKKYNNSNGTEGDFVVVTNTSWGVNYGDPNSAPLWCEVYDLLGSVGILNAAATANLAINVDEEGDLPTTCPSDYLVTTTKVDHNDELPSNAGYGTLSIDLAAFGKNVFTTKTNNFYGNLSGTSAAAPQIAGAIALLYSAPCPSFIALAKSQPQAASILVKDYILNGTEENANLENITVTGGRLNVANSLQLLMNECNYSGCYPPYSIFIEDVSEESASIDWLIGFETTSVSIRFRPVGEPDWMVINNVSTPFGLSGLMPCTNYEFQVSSQCGPLFSDYSLSYEFQTAGCCDPPALFHATSIEENQLSLEWSEVSSAISYQIRYREVNSGGWNLLSQNDLEVTIPDLNSCSIYEFQIRSNCIGGQTSVYSQTLIASTIGCSNCIELPYCQNSANPLSFSWIKQVNLSDINYSSGNSSSGYSDNTDQSAELVQGQSYDIKLKSKSALGPLPGFFKVWIDFNQNGLFEDLTELILKSVNPEENREEIIVIPIDATLGSTRMRVSFLDQIFDSSCGESFFMGEIEDYCVNIVPPSGCLPPISINSTVEKDSVEISWLGNLFTDSYLIKYKEVIDTSWNSVSCPNSPIVINNLNECTDYEFIIYSICSGEPSIPSENNYFTTKGCGSCLDNDYCSINEANTAFEWIERVQLSAIDNISGSNNGFAYFTDYSTNLIKGNIYPLKITPGFSNSQNPEYEYYLVWIDFDHDGVFSSNEIIYDSDYAITVNAEGIIMIPETAVVGSTRMRVLMRYQGPPSSPCNYGFYGEIEEYCINIVEDESPVCNNPENMEISASDFSAVLSWQAIANAISYTFRYQRADTINNWKYITNNNNSFNLYQLDSCSAYQFQVRTICDFGLSGFSALNEFETNCGVSTNSSSSEKQILGSINLFPNPAQDQFFVTYHLNVQTEVNLELYDLTGKLLINKKIQTGSGEQQIEMTFPEGCSDGIYYLKVKRNNESPSILKVVKTN